MPALQDFSRAVSRYRVLLSAGLAAAAVATGIAALAPTPEPGVTVLMAARDLTSGIPLTDEDLVVTSLPASLVPTGALADPTAVLGRLVAGPVRQGETLTDVRLFGAGLLGPDRLGSDGLGSSGLGSDGLGSSAAGQTFAAGRVAVPVRVAEPATAALLSPGDRVDILAASPDGGPVATVVAGGLTVLAVPVLGDAAGEGALLVLAADRAAAARLAAAAVTARLSVAVLSPTAPAGISATIPGPRAPATPTPTTPTLTTPAPTTPAPTTPAPTTPTPQGIS